MLGADLERRAEALVVVRRRQPDVDDRDVRRVAAHLEQEVVGVLAAAPPRRIPLSTQQTLESLAQQDAVLGDRYAHGISARTRVPAPSGGPDLQAAVERLDPVGEAAQPGALLHVGAADAVVDDLHHDHAALPRHLDRHGLGLRVLADVGEALGDDVVRGDLERLGKALRSTSTVSRTGTGPARRAARARLRARGR